ncbi:Inner membrane ABC transporter permease protein YcjP [subsurface metagenome]
MRVKKRLLGCFILYGLVAIVTVLFLFPILFAVLVSFKLNREIFTYPPSVFPRTWIVEAYIFVLSQKKYLRYFFNSCVISILATFICVTLGSLAGYGFSRFKLPGKRLLMLGILALQMFPGVVLMIPYFRLARILNLYDTYLVLVIINCAFVLPLAIWLLKSYFDSIPVEIEEAAMVDGCTRLKALFFVVAPLSRAGVIAIGIMAFLKAWNEFMFALILTRGAENAPISVGLAGLFQAYSVNWNAVLAVTMISVFPLMITFIFLQRYIISGITSGAVK